MNFDQGDNENGNDPIGNEGTEAEFSIDPAVVRGLKDHQPGDKVSFQVDATMGETDPDTGKATFTIDRIVADPINPAKKAGRDMMGRKPSMAGTAMETGGGDSGSY